MINIICYILCTYGLSNLLVYGSGPFDILGKFREFCDENIPVLGNMLECMMCTSANIGWFFSFINVVFIPHVSITPFMEIINDTSLWYLIIPMDMFITSGTVWIIHTFQEMMERMHTNYNEDE